MMKFYAKLQKNDIQFIRGNEHNVLDRPFWHQKYRPGSTLEYVHNPFIDVMRLINLYHYLIKEYDYAFNHLSKKISNHPDGFGAEIFKPSTLSKIKNNR